MAGILTDANENAARENLLSLIAAAREEGDSVGGVKVITAALYDLIKDMDLELGSMETYLGR